MTTTILVAALLIAGFLLGIRLMQSPETALWGNRLGALCMLGAVVFTILGIEAAGDLSLWALLLAGGLLGITLGQRVKMIQMPQTVALLNGFGGGASALVAVTAVSLYSGGELRVFWFTAALALAVGALTFSGSMVAALKLQGLVSQRPLVLKNHGGLLKAFLTVGALLVLLSIFLQEASYLFPLVALVFLLYGILMAIRIGGADMPVIISFLNSLSGVAAAISGLAVENLLLVGVGALVGVAGLILTQIMCRAMNRNLASVISGFQTQARAGKEETAAAGTPEALEKEASPEETLESALLQARRVILIPGYGMALAQAQRAVKDLIDALQEAGKEVKVAIHPVAGRMPGHMHVLLAEVGIDYEMLHDLEAINPEFASTDLVVVVGACDVLNPAANTAEGTPIYGMPVLNAEEARRVIVCNLDEKPGYSGVDNTLYGESHVFKLWGNAAETVPSLTALLKGEEGGGICLMPPGEETPEEEGSEAGSAGAEASPEEFLCSILPPAKKVIIVPGYGMALAQAQKAVKDLMDALEREGKEVKLAIHPVAGRMPGHMHVLLAEVGIDYEKLHDMEAINPEFAATDLVVVVGACDVINPAANTAEGTPIYGMPVLNVEEAKQVIVCNLDEKPGYSGVDNTLYGESYVFKLWGNAAETVPRITGAVKG